MKQFILLFILFFSCNFINAQYYPVPDWFVNIPLSSESCIYSIGISEPRMEDSVLAKEVAINRAISVAGLLYNSKISYSSDYFETKSEEHRTFILKETFQELAKIDAKANYSKTSYDILKCETNDNGETIVLIAYYPNKKGNVANICGEYFRQDFEVSNTRSLESISSLLLSYESIVDNKSFNTNFKAVTAYNHISFYINYDSINIEPRGYFYSYVGIDENEIIQKAFISSTNLEKGLWNAFITSLYAGMIRKTKNYKSKIELSNDIYSTAVDNTPDVSQGALSRQVSRNDMQFRLGSIVVSNNSLYLSLLYNYEAPEKLFVNRQTESEKDNSKANNKKPSFFKRIFKKKSKK